MPGVRHQDGVHGARAGRGPQVRLPHPRRELRRRLGRPHRQARRGQVALRPPGTPGTAAGKEGSHIIELVPLDK